MKNSTRESKSQIILSLGGDVRVCTLCGHYVKPKDYKLNSCPKCYKKVFLNMK